MLFKMLKIPEAFSRSSKFVRIAVIGLLLAFIVQVVGYSTNNWLRKSAGESMYYTYGLWKHCFCSARCYCDVRALTDSGMMISLVFESLGLVGLVAVLVLTLVGIFLKEYHAIIKVSATVACFLTSAFIFAGLAGVIAILTADKLQLTSLDFSFGFSATSGSLTLVCAFLLIFDIKPRDRSPDYTENHRAVADPDRPNIPLQTRNQRPTLGEYLNQRNTEPLYDNRRSREGNNPGRRKERTANRYQSDTKELLGYENRGGENTFSNEPDDSQRPNISENFRNQKTQNSIRTVEGDMYDAGMKNIVQYSDPRDLRYIGNDSMESVQYSRGHERRDQSKTQSHQIVKKETDQRRRHRRDVEYTGSRTREHRNAERAARDARRTNIDDHTNEQFSTKNDYMYQQKQYNREVPNDFHGLENQRTPSRAIHKTPDENQFTDAVQTYSRRNQIEKPLEARLIQHRDVAQTHSRRNQEDISIEPQQTQPRDAIESYSRRNKMDTFASQHYNKEDYFHPQTYDYENEAFNPEPYETLHSAVPDIITSSYERQKTPPIQTITLPGGSTETTV